MSICRSGVVRTKVIMGEALRLCCASSGIFSEVKWGDGSQLAWVLINAEKQRNSTVLHSQFASSSVVSANSIAPDDLQQRLPRAYGADLDLDDQRDGSP